MSHLVSSLRGAFAAVLVAASCAAPAPAIEFLQPGHQVLEGVLVADPGVRGMFDKFLVLAPGTRSEQRVGLDLDQTSPGFPELFQALDAAAVDIRARGDRYPGVEPVAIRGVLAGQVGRFRLTVHRVEPATESLVPDVVRRWKARVTGPEDMATREAAAALATLESLGFARSFARDAIRAAR